MKKLSLALCEILLVTAAAQAADNFLGTWTLNVAKSKYDPGPAPKSQTTILETIADGSTKERGDRVNADGSRTQWEWTAKFDGKDYPVKGDPSRDSGSIRKIDDYTVEITNKKAGKVMNVAHITIARDGKSRDSNVTGMDGQGRPVHNTLLWERQ